MKKETGPLNQETGPLNQETGPLNQETGPLNRFKLSFEQIFDYFERKKALFASFLV